MLGVDDMSFLDTIKKVENQYDGVVIEPLERLDEVKPACEELICKCVDEIKQKLISNAQSQLKSYNQHTVLGKHIKTSPVYTANTNLYFCYDPYHASFEETSFMEAYADYSTQCYATHSPEIVFYVIREISRRLEAEQITPCEWKKTGKQYSNDGKHVTVSFPTSEQKDRINSTYKEMRKAIKKKEFVKVKNNAFHFYISLGFMVPAEK